MGLSSALGSALSGLKASQSGLDLVAANVANARTPGYTKKTLVTEASVAGGVTNGVRVSDVRRELDVYLQRQLRSETAGASYASARADYLDRLQTIFGTPGGALSLDTGVNDFSSSLAALAASPDDVGAQGAALAAAQALAQNLNAASKNVQNLRAEADQSISDAVSQANEALGSIERYSAQIVAARTRGEPTADLEDLRDAAVDTLSSLMDVKVDNLGAGDVRVKTASGLTLYEAGRASSLGFEASGTVSPGSSYGSELSGVTLTRPSGQTVDLLAAGQLRSGSIRALADLRDTTLTQAQSQLDELAANLAQALGTKVTDGTVIAGGVSLAAGGALAGDRLSLSLTIDGVARTVTIVNVGDPSKLPLPDSATSDPADLVIGVDFSSATAAADMQAALGARGVSVNVAGDASAFSFTSGAAGATVTGGQSRLTATAVMGDGLAVPLFVDGETGGAYSGSLDGKGQRLGFAARITVNPALLDDPSLLTAYAPGVAAADSARADFMRDALTTKRSYAPDSGLGGASRPFSGSIADFAQGVIAMQARASATATRVSEGQSMVVSSLSDRFSSVSGVDVDEEMSRLIQLQTAYGANARVVTAVKEMIDMLMKV